MAVMMRSMLEVADNSGARKLQMILPLGGSTVTRTGRHNHRGGQSRRLRPSSEGQSGESGYRAHAQRHRRRDGTYIRFDQNAAVLINEAERTGGNTRLWSVARELRERSS
jgi:large subunit ribosomal protein L14